MIIDIFHGENVSFLCLKSIKRAIVVTAQSADEVLFMHYHVSQTKNEVSIS